MRRDTIAPISFQTFPTSHTLQQRVKPYALNLLWQAVLSCQCSVFTKG